MIFGISLPDFFPLKIGPHLPSYLFEYQIDWFWKMLESLFKLLEELYNHNFNRTPPNKTQLKANFQRI
jgi:hypothetical protein